MLGLAAIAGVLIEFGDGLNNIMVLYDFPQKEAATRAKS